MIRKQEATGKTVDEARAKACALLVFFEGAFEFGG